MQLTKFQELWQVVSLYDLDKITQTTVKEFAEKGLKTDLSDVFQADNNELITVLADGTIRKTIVYISEMKSWQVEKYNNYPKFHIFNCKTLIDMRLNDRSYRYRKTSRMDGVFLMIISGKYDSHDTKFIELEICGHCLNQYNALYNTKYTKQNFDINKYIRAHTNQYISDLNCTEFDDDLETVPIHYAQNWQQISKELKHLNNYICQKCGIDLKNAKQYLHTHHIDSNPSNNIVSNLKVLCIGCHAEEFNHSHIKTNPRYTAFLEYKQVVIH